MPFSGELREKMIMEELDEEDTLYLQQGFLELMDEADCKNKISPFDENQYIKLENTSPISEENKSFEWFSNNLNKIQKAFNCSSLDLKLETSSRKPMTYEALFQGLLDNGVDEEDIHYLKSSFDNLSESSHPLVSGLFWDYHLPTSCNDSNAVSEDYLLKTGSARTEGFFKLEKHSAFSPKKIRRKDKRLANTVNGTVHNAIHNDQRRLLTAYESITKSDLLNLNILKFRKKKLRLGKSEIHGLGVFASEPIAPNDFIIEYVGEIIRPIIADIRESKNKLSGIGAYCFRVDCNTILDATKLGNLNRFINHSCSPNSYSKSMIVNNQKKVVIFSKRFIKVDEEITYNYNMPYEDEKIKCNCKAPRCKKYLN